MIMLNIGTDCSGLGSPECAINKIGIEHTNIFACDIDKWAKQAYTTYHSVNTFYDNITTRNHNDIKENIDLYIAGFPCQAFSSAGKRLGFSDVRGTIFFNVHEFLKIKRPKYFILENVKGLLTHEKGETFNTIIDHLAKSINGKVLENQHPESIGYHIYYKVLNSKNYGIPQNRERIFIVGFRDDTHNFEFPKEIDLNIKLKDILEINPDKKFNLSVRTILGRIKSNYAERVPQDLNGSCHTIKVGGDQKFIDPSGFSLKMKEYLAKGIIEIGSDFIFNKENGKTISSEDIKSLGIRQLTPLECFRLQGFPDDYYYSLKDKISVTQLYKLAGNSMTVNVMEAIIKNIIKNE